MRKYSAEDKLRMVKLILEAKHSITSVSTGEGIHPTTLEEWIRNYQSMGSETFYNKGWTKRTSAEKEIAVQEYLSGLGSLRDICKKHKISSTRTLRKWLTATGMRPAFQSCMSPELFSSRTVKRF